jgi:hypothetical protein
VVRNAGQLKFESYMINVFLDGRRHLIHDELGYKNAAPPEPKGKNIILLQEFRSSGAESQ